LSLAFDLYWSVRSPYCYLAAPRLLRLQQEFDVQCTVRPVYPHAMRDQETVSRRDSLWLSYFKTDIVRTAAFLGMPIGWPRPDPVRVDPETGRCPAEQPLAQRLTHLILAAEKSGAGLPFIERLSARLWSPATADWTAPGVLESVAQEAGLALASLESMCRANAEAFDRAIAENDRAEREAGHWGVPVMVFEGEPFFGQDRIDQLIWRMRQRGLARRALKAEAAQEGNENAGLAAAVQDGSYAY
jgi:2-hydroxychromene-2-carboxylate isomerase